MKFKHSLQSSNVAVTEEVNAELLKQQSVSNQAMTIIADSLGVEVKGYWSEFKDRNDKAQKRFNLSGETCQAVLDALTKLK